MFSKILLIALLSSASASSLRTIDNGDYEHLDLEVMVAGERQLFPLLPGTKCPTGHVCRTHNKQIIAGQSPMLGALKNNLKTPLAMAMEWSELNNNLNTVVDSNNRCSRRQAMARAAGLAAGVATATVAQPAFAAETKEVKMGTDSGGLQFVPAKTSICKGDSVKWYVVRSGYRWRWSLMCLSHLSHCLLYPTLYHNTGSSTRRDPTMSSSTKMKFQRAFHRRKSRWKTS